MVDDNITEEELVERIHPARIDDATMYQIEKNASSKERSQARRMMLVALARDLDQLSDISINYPEEYEAMIEAIKDYKEHVAGLLEASEDAVLRMEIADCRQIA